MLTHERREQILGLLNKNGTVSVTELAIMFETSESTIRRDLAALSDLGKLNKVYGGATALSEEFGKTEDRMEAKTLKNVDEKMKIAQYAVSLINDDDSVFIDAGSTTYLMTTIIDNCRASFVTNGIAHAKELAARGCRVFVLGGELKESTGAIKGLMASENLQSYNFSKAFIGANGVSVKQGFTTPDPDEAMLKAAAIKRSFVSYVLCDRTKFNKVFAVSFGKLDAAAIVTDRCEDEMILENALVKEVN
ncbi:MAG: DeoR/GlpR family DNA-binding transcription regulator [Lachnospiraceae bacterium]|nr:DeoR/GlpR family DNA-binding transcription regulator [Lachnospiraceae bacterium]